jgi:hypothetical protein
MWPFHQRLDRPGTLTNRLRGNVYVPSKIPHGAPFGILLLIFEKLFGIHATRLVNPG